MGGPRGNPHYNHPPNSPASRPANTLAGPIHSHPTGPLRGHRRGHLANPYADPCRGHPLSPGGSHPAIPAHSQSAASFPLAPMPGPSRLLPYSRLLSPRSVVQGICLPGHPPRAYCLGLVGAGAFVSPAAPCGVALGSAKGGGVVLPGSPPQQCARTPLRSGSPTGPRGPPVTGQPLGSPSKRTCPQKGPLAASFPLASPADPRAPIT